VKIIVNEKTLEGDIELAAGRNIEVKASGNKVFIEAPQLNQTRIKHAEFDLQGDYIEIRAGKGIHLSSISPNVLVISSQHNEIEAQYIDLQKRFENLESLVLKQIKK
jgi:hypothetical protein